MKNMHTAVVGLMAFIFPVNGDSGGSYSNQRRLADPSKHERKLEEWFMTYGKGTFQSFDQYPDLMNAGSEITKQNGKRNNPVFYVRRICKDCAKSHQDIIYKRLTDVPSDMDLGDLFLANWSKKDNVLGVDFKLFSTFEDAQKGSNEWKSCNYDDPGIGFPRDCGPVSQVGGQWNSLTRGGKKDISYYVWDKNPIIGTLILPASDWLMTYGKGAFQSFDQDPALMNAGSEMTKQNGKWDGPVFYVRRLCKDCAKSHQDIIYKRLTDVPSDMDLGDLFLANWSKKDNVLGVDFKLFSTFEDAQKGSNEWQFCNYNDPGIGFPRDCGPVSHVGGQWNSLTRGGKEDISYYVWDENPTIGTLILQTQAPTKYKSSGGSGGGSGGGLSNEKNDEFKGEGIDIKDRIGD